MKDLMIDYLNWCAGWVYPFTCLVNNTPVTYWQDDNNNVYTAEKLYEIYLKQKIKES